MPDPSPGGQPREGPPGQRDSPDVIAPPPLVYLAALAVGFSLEAVLPSVSVPGAVAWPVGAALVAAGLALIWAFLGSFRRARTPADPRKGTRAIVTTGPYRLTRNPGYLGLTLTYVGITVLTGTLWALATLLPALVVVDLAVVRREERYLERKFGEEYLRFKARTRRWI